MISMEKQEKPDMATSFACPNCQSDLFEGDETHPRWNYCPLCGQPIEWDKAQRVVQEEISCKICGSWLVKKNLAGFWYASSDYIGMDTCRTCWIEECCTTNCLGCKRGKYPNCKWLDLKKFYMTYSDSE